MSPTDSLEAHCDLLRSLHVPGDPLVLPNAWDVATAKAVVAAGFPVVATTSGGVAASLGYDDHEGAPAEEMLAAAARIVRSVEVPVTVVGEALERADAYMEAGVDCVFPIGLWETEALADFVSQAPGPVNALRSARAPSIEELARLGV